MTEPIHGPADEPIPTEEAADSALPSLACAIHLVDGSQCVVAQDADDVSDNWLDGLGEEPLTLLTYTDIWGWDWYIDPSSITSVQQVDPAAWPPPSSAGSTAA